jgi:hypothetical protein
VCSHVKHVQQHISPRVANFDSLVCQNKKITPNPTNQEHQR